LYDSAGNYTVTLISTNANGCGDTLKQNIYIQLPQVKIITPRDSACAPIMKKFNAVINSPADSVVSYLWDFGDGTTSTETSPTHNFNTGVYNIKLIITTAKGCKDTATLVNGIVATEKPVVNFIANPTNVCAYVPIQFLDKSIGNVTKWVWKFGDGDTSRLKNPIHVYTDTGYMNVQLTVWNRGCSNTVTFPDYIYIKPPIAKFNFGYSCREPLKKYFYQFSIGADEWVWDFGDGTGSTDKNPIHNYPGTGNYTVVLTVKNHTTGCSYSTKRVIPVVIEKANFIMSDSVVCKRDSITFTSIGTNSKNVLFYSWNFGNGKVDTGQIVKHSFNAIGTYAVRLIITNKLWCRDTLIKYIKVTGPTAKFSPSLPGNCYQSAVIFIDSSKNDDTYPIVTWNWNYGDSTSESLTSPPFKHTYNNTGLYRVFLQVVDNNGCTDTLTLTAPLIVSRSIANFGALTTISCPNKNITFRDSSKGLNLSYKWSFGDGTTSIVAHPIHKYAQDGLYTVKLIVTDKYGCTDTMTKLNYITIATPKADFKMSDSVGTCPPLVVDFTNTSKNFRSVLWDFGDGTFTTADNPSHFYSTPGIYNAKLTITSWGGCTDSIQKQIKALGPSGSFTYGPVIGCAPKKINFTSNTINAAEFLWDFNDGSVFNGADSAISHIYTINGSYVPKMILIDANGCRVPINGTDTIHIKGVTANFSQSKKLLCDPGTVQFSDSTVSNDIIVNRQWDFGDGNSSTDKDPSHFYNAVGLYYPRLISTTLNGCIDTITYPAPIKIVPTPQAQITSTASGCTPLSVTFKGELLAQDTAALTWNWNFANSNTSNLQNPLPEIYNTASKYTIKLLVTNSSGCTDTLNKDIEAYPIPNVQASRDTIICFGTGTQLNVKGADSYTWTPAARLNCTDCNNPVANPDSLTNYIVQGSTIYGCKNSDTIQVRVKYPFTINNTINDTLCRGESKRLFASGGYSYVWSPATGLNDPTTANPIVNPTSTTTYTVIGTDELGCFKDTGYVLVTVYPIPAVNAGQDKTVNIGEITTLPVSYSADVTTVTWTPHPSILSINPDSIVVKPRETTEYAVEVKNRAGCKTKDKVTVFVICNGANIFIPNTFSPNGDGANDRFYPRGKGLFSVKTLRIFNRWGEVVFEKNDFMPNDESSGWDGTYKGIKLNPDVYVYTLNIHCDNSSTLTFKGNVTLIQ
jgi:gliding motility-associated-like protein